MVAVGLDEAVNELEIWPDLILADRAGCWCPILFRSLSVASAVSRQMHHGLGTAFNLARLAHSRQRSAPTRLACRFACSSHYCTGAPSAGIERSGLVRDAENQPRGSSFTSVFSTFGFDAISQSSFRMVTVDGTSMA